ncbi:phage major capsid protein [Mycolicibacterium cosmeticum]|uniref:Phage major capsid protein, HK97 n=1 Tax=Mycolicibacterium cosmeticum TaxID=258533 RepID=W9AIY7_MYCCO|nr:phage major capsid protein [Mycolicibacterium cosmeticum]TLH72962.1 phage major capsid protein [Mycolicibacterium cosmeticum]CDO05438.1 phage major capsid protein, HK97 [Mycolicibacterium cosmeticum]
MALNTSVSGGTHALLKEQLGALVTQPVRESSVALNVAGVVTTLETEYRVPIVKSDAAAAWVAEGGEIAATDADFDEIVVRPAKVAGLSIISRELAEDSTPSAQQQVGEGLAQSIATGVDRAFFGNTVADGPSGLLSVTGVQTIDTGGTIANTDPFAEALSLAETVGAQVTSFVAHPTTVLQLSKVKKQTGSNEPLLGYDASQPTQRQVLGIRLISSPAVAVGDVWAIPQAKVLVVLRDDVRLDVDRSRYFETDRVGIKATMRVGFAFPHPAAIVRLYDAP